jgi:DNA polymerase bacteriophage-type
MKTLSVDIETYSEVALGSCGAYRYAYDPSFRILLFGYSEDYGQPTVVDLASGEEIPKRILCALEDPSILKTAYNAPFERTCLTAGLGVSCPPEQWECTMVLAAQMGLPLGLDAVSKALKLSTDKAKMSEGKALIRYFCMPCRPTKINKGRTRNLPHHAPKKWEAFKTYCGRDVAVENLVRQKFLKYKPDATEQRFWCLDQKINDTGVRVDLALVRNAIELDTANKEALTEKAIKLTGMDNPSSVAQIKDWLLDVEGIDVESLNKKEIPALREQLSDERTFKFIDIRSELAKSSTKKYDAIIRSACADDHVRGLFQFYGANRTGRFCLAEDTRVLVRTREGEALEKPIQSVLLSDEVWDGDEWVHHEGVVFSGVKEVITYDGVTATRDHYIYTSSEEKMRLEDAMKKGVKLWRGDTPSTK